MTNKKNIASKLVLALFILTLISCCLLGSTFARYVSGGTGEATIGVAEWDVSIDDSAMATITVDDKLSPSAAVFDADATNARSNSTGRLPVATITNNGDVNALVSVSGTDTITATAGVSFGETEVTPENYTTVSAPTQTQVEDLFSVTLYYYAGSDNADSASELTSAQTVAANGGSIYIYAVVTWTSDDKVEGATAAYADAIDTWVGENVTSLSFTLSYTAVQNSKLP